MTEVPSPLQYVVMVCHDANPQIRAYGPFNSFEAADAWRITHVKQPDYSVNPILPTTMYGKAHDCIVWPQTKQ